MAIGSKLQLAGAGGGGLGASLASFLAILASLNFSILS